MIILVTLEIIIHYDGYHQPPWTFIKHHWPWWMVHCKPSSTISLPYPSSLPFSGPHFDHHHHWNLGNHHYHLVIMITPLSSLVSSVVSCSSLLLLHHDCQGNSSIVIIMMYFDAANIFSRQIMVKKAGRFSAHLRLLWGPHFREQCPYHRMPILAECFDHLVGCIVVLLSLCIHLTYTHLYIYICGLIDR